MNKLLDVFVVVVVFIFAALLVLTLMKTCQKPPVKTDDSKLESSVKMGDKKEIPENEVSDADPDAETWDENIDKNDTTTFEADGVAPEDVERLDTELASKLAEQGDEGVKKEKKKDKEPEADEPEENSSVNISPESNAFIVIAGSFKEPANASNLVEKLKGLGYPAEVVQFLNNDLKSVSVQRFASGAEASNLVRELKAKHQMSAYVVKRRKK